MLKILQELLDIWVKLLAPEVLCSQNHGVAVDYFAVGIIGYELMFHHV